MGSQPLLNLFGILLFVKKNSKNSGRQNKKIGAEQGTVQTTGQCLCDNRYIAIFVIDNGGAKWLILEKSKSARSCIRRYGA